MSIIDLVIRYIIPQKVTKKHNVGSKPGETACILSLLRFCKEYWYTPEEVKSNANLNMGVPAIARKLRAYRSIGLVESRKREGKTYVEYRAI